MSEGIGYWKGLIITMRPMVGIVTIPWTAAMAMLAAYLLGVEGGYVSTLLLIMIASYLGVTAGYAVNDYNADFRLCFRCTRLYQRSCLRYVN